VQHRSEFETRQALALTLLGANDVAVYDGSLVEWSARAELPLESGQS
jgi:thiosulfate/3-mercaptopyruvate sulfurtransferase